MPNWNELFTEKENRWVNIFEDVETCVRTGRFSAGMTVLDLGSGAGRHLKYLEENALVTVGMDCAWNGLDASRSLLQSQSLPIRLIQADMSDTLPFGTECFDAVVSIHVIFHNPTTKIKMTMAEIKRVLKPGGLALITFNTVYNPRSGHGLELEPGTWVPDTGIDQGIPHHFSDFSDLADLLREFKVLHVRLDEHRDHDHLSSHWVALVQKI